MLNRISDVSASQRCPTRHSKAPVMDFAAASICNSSAREKMANTAPGMSPCAQLTFSTAAGEACIQKAPTIRLNRLTESAAGRPFLKERL
jgi:hypothetical protein